MFTRQHYQKIAETVGQMPPSQFSQPMLNVLITMFKSDNYKFCPHLFMSAYEKEYRIHWGTLENPTEAFIQDIANFPPHIREVIAVIMNNES
tara:strand:- start:464 stop:739 length:276 start_codon:yes stop_codon:yes gene_type:complete